MRFGIVLYGSLAAAVGCFPEPPPVDGDNGGVQPEIRYGEEITSGDWSMQLPLGLEARFAFIPADNPISDAKIELGRALFFDPRLSIDATVSCASCHLPSTSGTDNRAFSIGVGGAIGNRTSPPMINRLFSREQFWDGRAPDLETQALGPIVAEVEMANTHENAVSTLEQIAGYGPLFEAAFGTPIIDIDRVAKAIATYQRVVVAGDSPYDRFIAGDADALNESARRGLVLFEGKAQCDLCHRGHNFSAEEYRNIGVGMAEADPDLGRFLVSGEEPDRGAFKTPTVRNIAMTAPYMHDGSVANLIDVVEYYDRGGFPNPWLHSDVDPLDLTWQEKQDLVEFMVALTGKVLNAEPPAQLPQ